MQETIPSPQPLLSASFAFLKSIGFDLSSYRVKKTWGDHLCYRAPDPERWESLTNAFKETAALVKESPIGGRPVRLFKLSVPFHFEGVSFPYVKLPQPKPNSTYPEGWQVVQFAIGLAPGRSAFETMQDFVVHYPQCRKRFVTAGLTPEKANPEVVLVVPPDGKYEIGFHSRPLIDMM